MIWIQRGAAAIEGLAATAEVQAGPTCRTKDSSSIREVSFLDARQLAER